MSAEIKRVYTDDQFQSIVDNLKPVNFKTLKALQPMLLNLNAAQAASQGEVPSVELMDAIVILVHTALVSQNPDMPLSYVEENLNMENAVPTTQKIFNVSGVKPKGEA